MRAPYAAKLLFAEKNYLPKKSKCFEINVRNMSSEETSYEMKTIKTFKINLDLFAIADMFLHLSLSIIFSLFAHLAQHKRYINERIFCLSFQKLLLVPTSDERRWNQLNTDIMWLHETCLIKSCSVEPIKIDIRTFKTCDLEVFPLSTSGRFIVKTLRRN